MKLIKGTAENLYSVRDYGYSIQWEKDSGSINLKVKDGYIESLLLFVDLTSIPGFYCEEYSKLLDKRLTKLVL